MSLQVLFFTIILAFFLTMLFLPILIPYLRSLKFGQSIREDGPKAHHKKSGTPTMGGIVIVLVVILVTLIMMWRYTTPTSYTALLVLSTVGFCLIGFIDDFIKVVLKRNLGLTVKQKLVGQIIVSLAIYFHIIFYNYGTSVYFNALNWEIDLLWLYPLFIVGYFIFVTNALNLTDGLDGLLSGTAAIAFGAFAVIAWEKQNLEVALFCMAIVGALLGFLFFNAHPAKIFMGDTGSIGLGGAIGAVALVLHLEFLAIIIGGIFVIEAFSVILQVISFRTTGKRIFKMSPLHHHYELCGWSEWRVVTTFWLIGFLFAVLGVYIEVWL